MIDKQIIESWHINNRVNLLLLDELTDEQMLATLSTRGGRTVGQQLAHMCWNRNYRIEKINKDYLPDVPSVSREDGHDKGILAQSFKTTAKVFEKIITVSLTNEGKVKSFKRGIVPMISYLISHESHHRGHILLTLKQCKLNLDSNFRMSLWDWNRI